jgi:hypothetical protein
LEKSIHRFLEEREEIISNPKILKAEFSVFEATNKRTKDLDILFVVLKTIKPRFSHGSVDILCLLKSYLLKKKTK